MEDDEPQIIYSPLAQRYTRDGTTVQILIYRGDDEDGWIMEVIDEEEGSTIWHERFPTDQAAFDEFLRTINENGIRVFLEDDPSAIN